MRSAVQNISSYVELSTIGKGLFDAYQQKKKKKDKNKRNTRKSTPTASPIATFDPSPAAAAAAAVVSETAGDNSDESCVEKINIS